jgi:hypothetical protein
MKFIQYLLFASILAFGVGQCCVNSRPEPKIIYKHPKPSPPDLGMLRLGGSVSDTQVNNSLKAYEIDMKAWEALSPEQKSEILPFTKNDQPIIPAWLSYSFICVSLIMLIYITMINVYQEVFKNYDN